MSGIVLGNVSHLLPLGGGDLESTGLEPTEFEPGAIGYYRDQLGPRWVRYVRNRIAGLATAAAKGALLSKRGDGSGKTAVNNITSGSTIQAVTTGLTVGDHEGAIAWVLDNDDSAGAAPEGEMAFVKRNTATVIDFDDKFPLTVALAANDDLVLEATTAAELSAADDVNNAVLGVVLAADGLPANNWGFVQQMGKCRAAITDAITATVNAQAIAGVGLVNVADAGATILEVIGHFVFAVGANDMVNDFAIVRLAVDEYAPSASTLDATA